MQLSDSLKKLFIYFINLNLLVALAAASQTAETYLLTGRIYDRFYILFVFCATIGLYSFQRIIKSDLPLEGKTSARFTWQEKNKNLTWLLFILGSLASFGLLFFQDRTSVLIILICGVLSVGYSSGIPFVTKKKFREIPGLKIFILTAVWILVTQVIPMLRNEISIAENWMRILSRFLFVFSICIPFDIRDMDRDPWKMKTIPQVIGRNNSIVLGIILLLLTIALYWNFLEVRPAIVMSFISFCAIIVIAGNYTKRNDLYYSGLTDSLLIFQFALVYLSFL